MKWLYVQFFFNWKAWNFPSAILGSAIYMRINLFVRLIDIIFSPCSIILVHAICGLSVFSFELFKSHQVVFEKSSEIIIIWLYQSNDSGWRETPKSLGERFETHLCPRYGCPKLAKKPIKMCYPIKSYKLLVSQISLYTAEKLENTRSPEPI